MFHVLKSTLSSRTGTWCTLKSQYIAWLKSTLSSRTGTASHEASVLPLCLNPPCPHGQGRRTTRTPSLSSRLKSTLSSRTGTVAIAGITSPLGLNPPCPHGQGPEPCHYLGELECLNPPCPHGQGQGCDLDELRSLA